MRQGGRRRLRRCWLVAATVLLAVLFASITAIAAGVGEPRYRMITSIDKESYYFDTVTLTNREDPYRYETLVDVWIKKVYSDDSGRDSYRLSRYYFRLKERQIQLMAEMSYDADNRVTDNQNYTYQADRWQDVYPETMADLWYQSVLKYRLPNHGEQSARTETTGGRSNNK